MLMIVLQILIDFCLTGADDEEAQAELAKAEAKVNSVPPKLHSVVHLIEGIPIKGPLSLSSTEE